MVLIRQNARAAIPYNYPGPCRILSGRKVAISGNMISTNTITTIIKNMGIAALAMKPIS
jgi:hypothetical protein